MTVNELIELLKQKPGHLQVVYKIHSEQQLLLDSDVEIKTLGEVRPDGWVQGLRQDKPSQQYLVLPGN